LPKQGLSKRKKREMPASGKRKTITEPEGREKGGGQQDFSKKRNMEGGGKAILSKKQTNKVRGVEFSFDHEGSKTVKRGKRYRTLSRE